MEIEVRRTGGIAGVDEGIGPVTANEAIQQQLDTVGFWELPDQVPGGEDIADAFQYAISVEDGDRQKTVWFTETPDDTHRGLQRLVALVEEVAGDFQDEGRARCRDWTAAYEGSTLKVTGRCRAPDGATLELKEGDPGINPEPGLLALQLDLKPSRLLRHPQDVTWTGELPNIERVRIQGGVDATIEVSSKTTY